jgi:hypothetical protein
MYYVFFSAISSEELSQRDDLQPADYNIPQPILDPLKTVPKASLDTLLSSLTGSHSQGMQSSLEEKTDFHAIKAEVAEIKEMSRTENANKGFLLKQDGGVAGISSYNSSLLTIDNTTSYIELAYTNSTTIPVLHDDRLSDEALTSSGFEPLSIGGIPETSSSGHVTLQSFLDAISQSRVEDTKVDWQDSVTEGAPFLLPFRTTLRTTTISTTSTTTIETTTAGKLSLRTYFFLLY